MPPPLYCAALIVPTLFDGSSWQMACSWPFLLCAGTFSKKDHLICVPSQIKSAIAAFNEKAHLEKGVGDEGWGRQLLWADDGGLV